MAGLGRGMWLTERRTNGFNFFGWKPRKKETTWKNQV